MKNPFTRLIARLSRLSVFARGFLTTFALDVLARGLSAIAIVVLVRTLSVESFAYVILFMTVGYFVGEAGANGIRLRYQRREAERMSRGTAAEPSFLSALAAGSSLILAFTCVGYVVATIAEVGPSASQRNTFVLVTAVFTLGYAATELARYHYMAHLAFNRAGVVGLVRNATVLAVAIGAAAGILNSGMAVATALALATGCATAIICGPLAWSSRAGLWAERRLGLDKEAASLTVFSVASAGWAYVSLLVVAAFLNDEAISSFGAATRYLSMITAPLPALLSVLRVRTFQHDVVDSRKAQIAMLASWAKRAAPPVLGVLGLAVLAVPFVIPLLDGGRYPLSVPILQIMMVPAAVALIALPSANLLLAQKRHTTLTWVNSAGVLGLVITAAAAAQWFGVVAIAAVTALWNVVQIATVTYLAAHPPARTGQNVAENAS